MRTRPLAEWSASLTPEEEMMGETFDSLDAYFRQVNNDPGSHAPDTAHDEIFMMHADDWTALEEAWPVRPAGWREECAYILEYGPPDHCLPLLERALFDQEGDVAVQAALSYASQILEHSRVSTVGPEVRARLRVLSAARDPRHMEELLELLHILDDLEDGSPDPRAQSREQGAERRALFPESAVKR
jgi:hypothetical protein